MCLPDNISATNAPIVSIKQAAMLHDVSPSRPFSHNSFNVDHEKVININHCIRFMLLFSYKIIIWMITSYYNMNDYQYSPHPHPHPIHHPSYLGLGLTIGVGLTSESNYKPVILLSLYFVII